MTKTSAKICALLCAAWAGLLAGCGGDAHAWQEAAETAAPVDAAAPVATTAPASAIVTVGGELQSFLVENEHGEAQLLEEFVPERAERRPAEERLTMGISRASYDDIGAILQAFRHSVDFEVVNLTGRNVDLEGLGALFINCGAEFNPGAVRDFVSAGGVVYASDLTSRQLIEAFPSKFEKTGSGSAGWIREARIEHSGMAAQLGAETMDIRFNLDSWSQVDATHEDVTVFITGLYQRERMPLAFSFDYGEGRVFYTTFHNNAQASRDMIVFIEYLVFSILNIEADRELEILFEREGFAQESSNFARFGVTFGDIMEQAGVEVFGDFSVEWDMDMDAAPNVAFDSAGSAGDMESVEIERATERRFAHSFEQGENILVIVDSAGWGFTLVVEDPAGNVFELRQEGARLTNVIGGRWTFTIRPDDAGTNHTFTLSVGRQR